ncbi:MAG: ABC transporter substrate-binding protein [Hyphomicrobiales bacterium]|nr:ABC transporter substrate-binding protein [Hyphomicrobiales bacterium]
MVLQIGVRAVASAAALFVVASSATAMEKVKVAIIGGTSDAGIYIARAKGWFKDSGLDVETIRMDSGARMIGPLSTGDIDVGTGVISAGLYNATLRGIIVKVVASKGRNVLGQSFQSIVVRKDLMDSGKIRTLADLVGKKFAFTAPGAVDNATLDEAMQKVGKSMKDVNTVYLGIPAQLAAYQNKGIDASVLPEPFRTQAIAKGMVRELIQVAEVRNNMDVGSIMYSDRFASKRKDAAQRFMTAYIRGVRFYNSGIVNGKLQGKTATEVIDILASYSSLKDKKLLATITPTFMDPDGGFNIKSIAMDLAFYKKIGMVKGKIEAARILDRSFVETAIRVLGPYKREQ